MIFNGEIYNFVELRDELEAWATRSARTPTRRCCCTATGRGVIELPRRSGRAVRLRARRPPRRRLFLARDRFGEKPLFVLRTHGYFAFASELRPLAALPDLDRRLDVAALGGIPVAQLRARRPDAAGGRAPAAPGHAGGTVSAEGERVGTLLGPAAETSPRLRGEWRPPSRSGGRSSTGRSAWPCAPTCPSEYSSPAGWTPRSSPKSAVRQGRLNRAYCLDFEEQEWSEKDAARTVADGWACPSRAPPSPATPSAIFCPSSRTPTTPSPTPRPWPSGRSRGTRHGENKVVLGGDGGDELYGGYLTYRASRLHAALTARLPVAAARGPGPRRAGAADARREGLAVRARAALPARRRPASGGSALHLERHLAPGRGGRFGARRRRARPGARRAARAGRAHGEGTSGRPPPLPARRHRGIPAQRHPGQGGPDDHGARPGGADAVPEP